MWSWRVSFQSRTPLLILDMPLRSVNMSPHSIVPQLISGDFGDSGACTYWDFPWRLWRRMTRFYRFCRFCWSLFLQILCNTRIRWVWNPTLHGFTKSDEVLFGHWAGWWVHKWVVSLGGGLSVRLERLPLFWEQCCIGWLVGLQPGRRLQVVTWVVVWVVGWAVCCVVGWVTW